MIRHEESVEFTPFKGLGVLNQALQIEIGVRRATRIAPGSSMNADRAHEGAEAKTFLFGHNTNFDFMGVTMTHAIVVVDRRSRNTIRREGHWNSNSVAIPMAEVAWLLGISSQVFQPPRGAK